MSNLNQPKYTPLENVIKRAHISIFEDEIKIRAYFRSSSELQELIFGCDDYFMFKNIVSQLFPNLVITAEREDFFRLVENGFHNPKVQKYYKSIIFLALVIGYPSIDYFLGMYEVEVAKKKYRGCSPEVALEKFLECMYYFLAHKTLRIIMFREYIKKNKPDATFLIEHIWPSGSDLPNMDELINSDAEVINAKAARFLEHINLHGRKLSRYSFDLDLIKADNLQSLLQKLKDIYSEKLERNDTSEHANFELYFQKSEV